MINLSTLSIAWINKIYFINKTLFCMEVGAGNCVLLLKFSDLVNLNLSIDTTAYTNKVIPFDPNNWDVVEVTHEYRKLKLDDLRYGYTDLPDYPVHIIKFEVDTVLQIVCGNINAEVIEGTWFSIVPL